MLAEWSPRMRRDAVASCRRHQRRRSLARYNRPPSPSVTTESAAAPNRRIEMWNAGVTRIRTATFVLASLWLAGCCKGDCDCPAGQRCQLFFNYCTSGPKGNTCANSSACSQGADCQSGFCASGLCRACNQDADCPTQYCDTNQGRCVPFCTTNADCSNGSICDIFAANKKRCIPDPNAALPKNATGICGDGVLNNGEECEPGHEAPGYKCGNMCQWIHHSCGDGQIIPQPPEECEPPGQRGNNSCANGSTQICSPQCVWTCL